MKKINAVLQYIATGLRETAEIFVAECKNIFKDSGVILIFFAAGFLYPLLYNFVYYNESVQELPVAVVDQSAGAGSRRFVKKLAATKEVQTVGCLNMDQAEQLMKRREVHGIVLIPGDYDKKLASREQATISMYLNMSCFIIYKSIALAVNFVMLDEGKNIQLERYGQMGIAGEQADQLVTALPYRENILFNPGNGFSSFFLPALMIIIIHQTLFFGIGMLAGTAREENKNRFLFSRVESSGIYRIVFGKAAAYLFIYSFLTAYITVLIPRIFNLPHLGSPWDIYKLMFPFLLATIFFSMTLSLVIKNRETGMVMFLFFSIILLFLSGFSWPATHFPAFWKYFSYLFPATFGVQGYLKINSMGGTIATAGTDYLALWIQTAVYFVTACGVMHYFVYKEGKEADIRPQV